MTHSTDPKRAKLQALAQAAIDRQDPTGWFDELYAQAQGDPQQIPWARLSPHPHLQDWLDTSQPMGNDRSALVVGCGLGDDAEALADLGFRVTAFDVSPTAIQWCDRRFPQSTVTYQVADLLALPPQWHQAFDLVVECRNIQALPLTLRTPAIVSISNTVAPGGTLLVITRLRPSEDPPSGPPWPLSEAELDQILTQGFQVQARQTFVLEDESPITQVWIAFLRS